jgi:enoyl-CoA hydratase
MAETAAATPMAVERRGAVVLLRINRPAVRNALDEPTLEAIASALEEADADEAIGAVVLTGSDKVFAAGADLKVMVERTSVDVMRGGQAERWRRIRQVLVPMVAAVNGYALGGGCELALCCDLIVAGESARFGQPEIKLGIIPGAGGTQRWARTAGRQAAMDIVLTGRMIDASEAQRLGVVNRLVADADTLEVALSLASEIAAMPRLAVRLAKRAVLSAFEMPLEAGLEVERQAFLLLLGTEDRIEGTRAFLDKRQPKFRGR